MSVKTMYQVKTIKATKLTSAITATDTQMHMADIREIPEAPNMIWIKSGSAFWERMRYTAVVPTTGNAGYLTVERSGPEHGSSENGVALAWGVGAQVYRGIGEYECNSLKENIEDLKSGLSAVASGVDTVNTFAHTHASRHKTGGEDPIKLDELGAPTDVTALDASTSAHGLLPKLPGLVTKILSGLGSWVDGPVNPNLLINGNFDIWQRGISVLTAPSKAYTADRWRTDYDGSGSVYSISQQVFPLGQTQVPNNPVNYLQYQVSTAGTGETKRTLQQAIEGVRWGSGEKLTVSFYSSADTVRQVSVGLTQCFGTGGTPSAEVVITPQQINLKPGFTKNILTFDIPGISGKTLGTAPNSDCLWLNFYLPINTTMTISFASVKVELGSIATPLIPLTFDEELSKCRRYFEKSYPYNMPIGTNLGPYATADRSNMMGFVASGTTNVGGTVNYMVPKRTTPTLSIYSQFGVPNRATYAGTTDYPVVSFDIGTSEKKDRFTIYLGGAGDSSFHYVADAEL